MDTIDEDQIKEQLAEEMAKYEDEGYFKRLVKMFAGLGKPRSTPEYKEALTELQRQIAPLCAILLPTMLVAILFVVTAISGDGKRELKVEIAEAQQEEEQLEEIETPPDTEPPPDTDIDVQVDTPTMDPTEVSNEPPAPTAEPQSVKVASVDAMLNIKSPVTMKSVMGTERNAGVRGAYTRGGAQYGDAATEAAVLKALRWLKYVQNPDGSMPGYDPAAATGLAVLSYLAHGETPGSKEFGPTVQKALDYLVNSVYIVKDKAGKEVKDPNGKTPYIKMRGATGSEYGFLIGTYALCEAYGMTKNPNAREAAEKTLGRIISGQTATGGWNYNMARVTKDGPDDISFGGWAMQAIKAGKMSGIHIPGMEECIKKAIKCLKTRNYSKKAGFVYRATTNHNGGSGGLGGVGCLCMQLLGYGKEPEVQNALTVMKDWLPTFDRKHMSGGESSQYYSYYASQCKYQAGMCKDALPANFTLWKKWNAEQKAFYPKKIIAYKVDHRTGKPAVYTDNKGKEQPMGFWLNNDVHSMRINVYSDADRKAVADKKKTWEQCTPVQSCGVMDTCLAALQLMVYYRYLPTTSLKAAEVEADVEALSKDKSGEVGVSIDI